MRASPIISILVLAIVSSIVMFTLHNATTLETYIPNLDIMTASLSGGDGEQNNLNFLKDINHFLVSNYWKSVEDYYDEEAYDDGHDDEEGVIDAKEVDTEETDSADEKESEKTHLRQRLKTN